jgi:hypothetical protein
MSAPPAKREADMTRAEILSTMAADSPNGMKAGGTLFMPADVAAELAREFGNHELADALAEWGSQLVMFKDGKVGLADDEESWL